MHAYVEINIELSRRRERIPFSEWHLICLLDICTFLGQILDFFVKNCLCNLARWKDVEVLCD